MTSRWLWVFGCTTCLTAVACGSSTDLENGDGGDASTTDAASPDATPLDGSPEDSTVFDAPVVDGSPADSTIPDAANVDGSPQDSAVFDADAESLDGSAADSAVSDAATADARSEASSDASEVPEAGTEASDAETADAADGSVDAATDAMADSGDAGAQAIDAGADASDGSTNLCDGVVCASGLCGSSLTAFTGSPTPGWNLNGNATYDSTTSTLVLVDGLSTVEAGTAIYQDPIAVDAFTVSFDFRFTTTNGRADGIAFLIETDGPNALGGGYGGFGVLGLHGYGVELDIFDSGPCDPGDGNHAGIDLLSPCSTNGGIPGSIAASGDLYDSTLPNNGVGDIGDGTWRTAMIQLASGEVTVAIVASGVSVPVGNLQSVTLPGFVSGTPYYLGFGGGSGSNGLASREEIRNVAVTFGSNHCL